CKMSERLLKTLRKFADFQAEYEGTTPFIPSSIFSNLTRAPDRIPTCSGASFLLAVAAYCCRSGEGDHALIRSEWISGNPHRTD
ncbi:MAG: hypothetical protein ABI146_01185, partial [Nitrobacter sp.]